MSTKRTVAQLGYSVSDDVLHAIDLLQHRYGATDYRDSGHTNTRPTWIFELPAFNAEVGVPMNKRDLSLYMRNRTLDGRKLTDLLSPEKVTKVYPRDGKPAQSIKDSSFLGPSKGNECVLLELERGDLEPLFEAFFAVQVSEPTYASSVAPHTSTPTLSAGDTSARVPIDAETFEALLDRRSEVGQAGELCAVQDEIERLKALGCSDPHCWVERVALTDVGRGYDIASTWPGHERYIEVKSSTSPTNGLFITDNERKVLTGLGARAWLYRVVVCKDGTSNLMVRLQDPMRFLPVAAFVPVVFRVNADSLMHATGKE